MGLSVGVSIVFDSPGTTLHLPRIIGNMVSKCSNCGIIISVLNAEFDTVVIDQNKVFGCSIGGIFVNIDAPLYRTVIIRENDCTENNTTETGAQIRYQMTGPANSVPRGIITGNNCHNESANIGGIQVNMIDGSGNPAALPPSAPAGYIPLIGCEIGYDLTTPTNRLFNNGSLMIHNLATLITP
jgi:hypothetical protein